MARVKGGMIMDRLVPIVGHQGGWDEVLMFAIPIVLAIVAIRLIDRRSRRREEDEDRG